jgi:Na+/H+ antiporter NhaD/arsenite permease-like protein
VTITLVVFALVYLGMLLGRLPRLGLDRTGVALLGAMALVVAGELDLERAAAAVDLPTIARLFGLMVVSAQLRLGGFYTRVTRLLVELELGPAALLLALVFGVGALAAVFSNDVVCLAVAPVLIDVCRRRSLDPLPFLLGLACAANVGSAATLIGNPQNMLIGETLDLSFARYLTLAAGPTVLGLGITWAVLARQSRGRWTLAPPPAAPGAPNEPRFDRWQTTKGLLVVGALLVLFLAAPWPRELVTLAAAGVLLTSRKLHSREMLGQVDWQLLVLFVGLFVVNDAFQSTGTPEIAVERLAAAGIDATSPAWLFAIVAVLGNVVSNVPAVMLLLPFATHPLAGPVLAISSTLAGNLILVGSIANLIVADAAARAGVPFDWRRHARAGVPVTLLTLLVAALWLRLAA